jgi:hypothetical protein
MAPVLDMTKVTVRYLLTSFGQIIEVFEVEPGVWRNLYTPRRAWSEQLGLWSDGELTAMELG